MAERYNPNLTKLSWKEARHLVRAANLNLAKAIDELDPSDEYALYHVRYPYGELLSNQSNLTLPTSSGLYLPYYSPDHPKGIAEDLGYGPIVPVSLVLKNTIELYCELDDRVKTLLLARTGDLVGVFQAMRLGTALDKNNTVSVAAGVRSLFMLPPIGDNIAHNRLMRLFDIHANAPKKLLDQWGVFRDIVRSREKELSWDVEVIFFSKKWFEETQDKSWRLFRQFLFEEVWRLVLRYSYVEFYELFLSQIQMQCNLRADPHLINTVHHLIYLAAGMSPGYSVVMSEEKAPVEFIQRVYVEDYRLAYAPILLGPEYFKETVPVYYSLEIPTNIHSTIRSRKRITRIEELREIRRTMMAMQKEIMRNHFDLEDIPQSIFHAAKATDFNYFHSEALQGDTIHMAAGVANWDLNMKAVCDQHQLPLCDTARFFWGCVGLGGKS